MRRASSWTSASKRRASGSRSRVVRAARPRRSPKASADANARVHARQTEVEHHAETVRGLPRAIASHNASAERQRGERAGKLERHAELTRTMAELARPMDRGTAGRRCDVDYGGPQNRLTPAADAHAQTSTRTRRRSIRTRRRSTCTRRRSTRTRRRSTRTRRRSTRTRRRSRSRRRNRRASAPRSRARRAARGLRPRQRTSRAARRRRPSPMRATGPAARRRRPSPMRVQPLGQSPLRGACTPISSASWMAPSSRRSPRSMRPRARPIAAFAEQSTRRDEADRRRESLVAELTAAAARLETARVAAGFEPAELRELLAAEPASRRCAREPARCARSRGRPRAHAGRRARAARRQSRRRAAGRSRRNRRPRVLEAGAPLSPGDAA